jgi:hypothetical protein
MKGILDTYLQSNYVEVKKYTDYFVSRSKLKIQSEVVISNAYLVLVGINPPLKEEYEVKGYLFDLIKKQLIWKGTSSKLELVRSLSCDQQKDHEADEYLINMEEEFKIQNYMAVIELYRHTQKDRIKRIFFETYYDKGYNTVRSIAQHFNISSFAAHGLITEIKEEIRELLKHGQIN